jgi:tetratricopeptide (TPR) repeat protein
MTDFTPFEELLRGHAGMLDDTPHRRWLRAQELFAQRSYREAAALLRELLDSTDAAEIGHGLTDARLLLARAYFHSAQLRRTIEAAEDLLAEDPTEPYAHLLLGRALQRQGRRDEARPHLRLAELLGGYRG